MPRNTHEHRPCSTGCGRTVPVVVGDTPRGPLWCDTCRPAGLPAARDTCHRHGCTEPVVKIVGAQRRRWELGRPVYCSPACRTAALSWVESCGHCRAPLLVSRKRLWSPGSAVYCSRGCQDAARRLPSRTCAQCGELFEPGESTRRFCSRPCAARSKNRRAAVPRTCPVCGRVDIVSPDTARRHPTCSQACGARYHNRPGAARRVDTPQVRNRH